MAGKITLLDKLIRESSQETSSNVDQLNPQYKLTLDITPSKRNEKLLKCTVQYGRELKSLSREKVIVMVSQTGAGKTTLINGFANYIYGVEWSDDFRLHVIDENESVSQSQTKNITAYTFPHVPGMKIDYTLTIVDTPGFGGTGTGYESLLQDRKITADIKEFFSECHQIHGVLFVTQASNVVLTQTLLYVFEAMLGVFGRDIADHIFLMTTFADGLRPAVLTTVKAANFPYKQYFKFNNSALYAIKSSHSGDSDDEDKGGSLEELSWKIGINSFLTKSKHRAFGRRKKS